MAETVSLNYANSELAKKADKNALDEHIAGDTQRWQQIADGNAALYASMVQIAQDVYKGAPVQYDMSRGTVIIGGGGIITLGGGGSWTAAQNGCIVCIYNSVFGGLASVSVNGTEQFNSGVSVLGLNGTPSDPIRINAGDVVTASGGLSLGGSFNVTFYPNK